MRNVHEKQMIAKRRQLRLVPDAPAITKRGKFYEHGDKSPDGARWYCSMQDIFCHCDHKEICDAALQRALANAGHR